MTEVLFEGFSASVLNYIREYIRRFTSFDPKDMADEFRVELNKMIKKYKNFSKK